MINHNFYHNAGVLLVLGALSHIYLRALFTQQTYLYALFAQQSHLCALLAPIKVFLFNNKVTFVLKWRKQLCELYYFHLSIYIVASTIVILVSNSAKFVHVRAQGVQKQGYFDC